MKPQRTPADKIYSQEQLLTFLNDWKTKGKIIFTNGCFDILHLGHLDYLEKASKLGHKLIIGLNSDASVRRIKGDDRPINNEHARALMLAHMTVVSAVVLFDEDTPFELIKKIIPDVLVKGSDYKIEEIIGSNIVLDNGGDVVTFDIVEGYSTSAFINKIQNGKS